MSNVRPVEPPAREVAIRDALVQLTLQQTPSIVLTLPTPPSTNNLFFNTRYGGRAITPRYATWIDEAGWTIKQQRPKPVRGWYALTILLPDLRGGDLSNRSKAVEDLLVKQQLLDDDRWCARLTLALAPKLDPHWCYVTVVEAEPLDLRGAA